MIKQISEMPLELRIALGAIFLSIVSLYLSLRNQRSTNKLDAAERKTALLVKILEAQSRLEKSLPNVKLAYDIYREGIGGHNSLKKRFEKLVKEEEKLIQRFVDSFSLIEKKKISSSIRIEQSMPFAYQLIQDADKMVIGADELLEASRKCVEEKNREGEDS